jgi:hypothetical protein
MDMLQTNRPSSPVSLLGLWGLGALGLWGFGATTPYPPARKFKNICKLILTHKLTRGAKGGLAPKGRSIQKFNLKVKFNLFQHKDFFQNFASHGKSSICLRSPRANWSLNPSGGTR